MGLISGLWPGRPGLSFPHLVLVDLDMRVLGHGHVGVWHSSSFFSFLTQEGRSCTKIYWYLELFIYTCHLDVKEKEPQSIMLPPPCFTGASWWLLDDGLFFFTWLNTFGMVWLTGIFQTVFQIFFCLATLHRSLDLCRIKDIIVTCTSSVGFMVASLQSFLLNFGGSSWSLQCLCGTSSLLADTAPNIQENAEATAGLIWFLIRITLIKFGTCHLPSGLILNVTATSGTAGEPIMKGCADLCNHFTKNVGFFWSTRFSLWCSTNQKYTNVAESSDYD